VPTSKSGNKNQKISVTAIQRGIEDAQLKKELINPLFVISSIRRKPLTTKKPNLVIAVSGKGEVGKTSTTAQMIKILSETPNKGSILAIDANPDATSQTF